MRLSALAPLLLLFSSPFANAQSIPDDWDERFSCAVTPDVFKGWFEGNTVVLNGFLNPANSLEFRPPAPCNFYQWAAHMFLWLTSPSPSKYGGGDKVFDSPLFFDVSAPDPHGRRTFIPHFPGFTRRLNVREAEAGPTGSPVLFDKAGRLIEVAQPQIGPNGLPLIRNRMGDLVEIGRATADSNQKPILIDTSGKLIDYELPETDPRFQTFELGRVISVQEFTVDGRPVFIDRNGAVTEIGVGQADSGVQLAQTNSLIYYATMVNDVYAYFRTGVKKNQIVANQFPTAEMDLEKITAFAEMHGKKFLEPNTLVVEVKTAWVEAGGLPNLDTYITINASVPTYKKSDPAQWVPIPNGWKTVELALVGMHVVGSAIGNPEMIWATFEHLGNAPNATYSYISRSGKQSVPQDTVGPWLFAARDAAPPFNRQRQQYVAPNICTLSTKLGVCGTSGIISPSNTLRSKAWGSASNISSAPESNTQIISLNHSIRNMMPSGDVRRNYLMVGATWTDGGRAPNGTNERGTSQLSNSTMETFQQGADETTLNGSSNCFSCHTSNKTTVSRIFHSLKPLF
jgi:hypothetical protein